MPTTTDASATDLNPLLAVLAAAVLLCMLRPPEVVRLDERRLILDGGKARWQEVAGLELQDTLLVAACALG